MSEVYGIMAEFVDKEQAIKAAQQAYAEGYRSMDAYSPYPVTELNSALGYRGNAVALITLLGGMAGGLGGFFMEWYSMAVLYPINIGGRPFVSWPNFIPVTFELTILCAALSALISMFALNRLPQPHHPVFNDRNFHRASQDRFFLCIEASDPKFDTTETKRFLQRLDAARVEEVLQ